VLTLWTEPLVNGANWQWSALTVDDLNPEKSVTNEIIKPKTNPHILRFSNLVVLDH